MCITSVLELVTETMTLVYGAKKGHMLISVNQTSHLPQGKIRNNVITMYMTSRQGTHS